MAEKPIEKLRDRFAEGEITKKEFEEKKKVLNEDNQSNTRKEDENLGKQSVQERYRPILIRHRSNDNGSYYSINIGFTNVD